MIKLSEVQKTYQIGEGKVAALQKISLEIKEGELLAIVGPSGSGKSTLLHLIGGLDKPSSGTIEVNGKSLKKMGDKTLSRYRNHQIGFIFQDFHLLPHLTLWENVQMPILLSTSKKEQKKDAEKEAKKWLEILGLKDRIHHKPHQVSGGQKQRTAIARALVNKPAILLADEPTGNLDSQTGKKTIELLQQIHRSNKMTMIIATHDKEIAACASRVIEIKDGVLITQNDMKTYMN